MTRSRGAESTTLAVQKWVAGPVAENRAPTVGTPANPRAVGVPLGGDPPDETAWAADVTATVAVRTSSVRISVAVRARHGVFRVVRI